MCVLILFSCNIYWKCLILRLTWLWNENNTNTRAIAFFYNNSDWFYVVNQHHRNMVMMVFVCLCCQIDHLNLHISLSTIIRIQHDEKDARAHLYLLNCEQKEYPRREVIYGERENSNYHIGTQLLDWLKFSQWIKSVRCIIWIQLKHKMKNKMNAL